MGQLKLRLFRGDIVSIGDNTSLKLGRAREGEAWIEFRAPKCTNIEVKRREDDSRGLQDDDASLIKANSLTVEDQRNNALNNRGIK